MTVALQELLLPTSAELIQGDLSEHAADDLHFVSQRPLRAPYVSQAEQQEQGLDLQEIVLGLGCFWGAERKFWNTEGVYTTAVGYAAGHTAKPTYQQVCGGATGHAEVVLVVFDNNTTSLEEILKVFFEAHNPTQGMRQGNDIGTQYRSGIYCLSDEQLEIAGRVKQSYADALAKQGYPAVTTDVEKIDRLYFAEEYHQQYLAKNPAGYCGIGGTGVTCAI